MKHTKTYTLILITAAIAAAMGLSSCTSGALKLNTPAVRAKIVGDVEKDLIAGGGALLISGGSTGAAVAAISAQEVRNLPELQKVLLPGKNPAAGDVTP